MNHNLIRRIDTENERVRGRIVIRRLSTAILAHRREQHKLYKYVVAPHTWIVASVRILCFMKRFVKKTK
jgi:hypothetical protein